MTQYLITFRSLTHAQRSARVLERAGITTAVIKAPQGLSSNGCAYAITLRRSPETALTLLKQNGLAIGKLFQRGTDGRYTEWKA